MTPEEQARAALNDFTKERGVVLGATARLEGQTESRPTGYGITYIENGIRTFETFEGSTPEPSNAWVDIDESRAFIRESGYNARIQYSGTRNVEVVLEGIGSKVWLAETHPIVANTIIQTGDRSEVRGSQFSDVVIADSVMGTKGDLGAGNDLLRIGLGTSYAEYDGQQGNDTISLSGFPVNSDIIAVFNREQVVLQSMSGSRIGIFENFEAFNHITANGSRDTKTISELLAAHADSEGFAQGIIHIEDDGRLQFVPLSQLPATPQSR